MAGRASTAIVLLALAAFCAFGFMATYEPMEASKQLTWRVIYVVVGIACLAGIVRLAIPRRSRPE